MLPTLEDFGVETPAYIRKIKRPDWHPEDCKNQQERAQKIAINIFSDGVNSLYLVKSNEDFYASVVATIINTKNPKDQKFDFIWITEEELQEVGIKFELVIEGNCSHSQKLHFNAFIDTNIACKLCENLLSKNREDKRCNKQKTIEIFNHLESLGCKAIEPNSPNCKCENQNSQKEINTTRKETE
jgi:hypothetical protein